MTYLKGILVLIVLALIAGPGLAGRECNLYNFSIRGAATCGLQWWQSNDLGETTVVTNKISDIARNVMNTINESLYHDLNLSLVGQIMAESNDPLAKVIESALAAFPSYVSFLADIMYSLELTPEMLQHFNLPQELATKEFLQLMTKEYFDFSCSSFGIKSVVSCLMNWVRLNCGYDDNVYRIDYMLSKVANEYCDGSSAKSAVLTTFNKNFGEIGKAVTKLYGIEKDPTSPYQFRLSNNSLLADLLSGTSVTVPGLSACSQPVVQLNTKISELSSPYSIVGTGIALESLSGKLDGYTECIFKVIPEVFPALASQSFIEKYTLFLRRLGL